MATTTVVANSFTAINNVSVVNDFDPLNPNDPYDYKTDDTTYTVAGNNGNVEARFGFPAATGGNGTLTTGAGVQRFNVVVVGDGGNNAIEYGLQLSENGNAIGNVITQTTIPANDQTERTATMTWDASGRTNGQIEVLVIQSNGGTGRASNRAFLLIDYVEWVAELDDAVSPGKSRAIWI